MNVVAILKNTFLKPGYMLYCTCLIFIVSAGQVKAEDITSGRLSPFLELSGGQMLRIGLQDAILMALERNPTVTIQNLQPDIANTYAKEQRAAFDPDLNITLNQSRSKLQRFLGTRPEPVDMTWDRSSYTISLSENLPTGTTLSANASMTGSVSSLYTDQYSGIVGVSVTQSLLQGFGLGANLANLRKAHLDFEMSKAEMKAVAEGVVADVEQAYWNLYLASEENAIQEQSLNLAERQLQESLERVTVGKLPELELAAVHAEVSTRREALIDAQSRYEQARLRFLFLLNPTDQSFWSMAPVPLDKPFLPADTLDVIDVHEQLGMKYRPDLIQARLALKKGDLDIQQTKNGLLPRLDVFITMGRTTYSSTFNEAIPDPTSRFFDASTGFTFALPVPNREARARVLRAQRSREQMDLSLRNMERLVQMDVRSAYIEVLRSKEQIGTTRVTRELQEKKLAAEEEKFRVGKSTNFLVLQAQRDLTASQLDEVRSMVAYLNALVNLYMMEGTLLDRRGINAPTDT